MTTIFPGRQLADQQLELLAKKAKRLKVTPQLQIILAGSDPASHLYVKLKQKAASRIGARVKVENLPATSSPTQITRIIKQASSDPKTHGLMVQLPLPAKLQNYQTNILSAIEPTKDVDCLTPENLGLLITGHPRFLPATAKAILTALEYAFHHTKPGLSQPRNSELDSESLTNNQPPITRNLHPFLKGQRVAILGAGLETGKPLANLLSNLGATVLWATVTETRLPKITRQADILISATGHPRLITKDHIRKGVIAIDIGASKSPKTGKIIGDLDFNSVKQKASFITPVPGGIGPLTVSNLLENLIQASRQSVT